MADNKVTPEMIDDELVMRIWNATGVPDYSIRDVLSYLANNPIVPSIDVCVELNSHRNEWPESLSYASRGDSFLRGIIAEFQRRAYLKREPELDPELRSMIAGMHPEVQKTARAAYELGKKASK